MTLLDKRSISRPIIIIIIIIKHILNAISRIISHRKVTRRQIIRNEQGAIP